MKVDAKAILRLREQRAWSQDELARASGLNLRTVQRIEKSGTASLQSTRALALALDLDPQDLNNKGERMSPCPECGSDDVYQSKKLVDSTTIGGELLPKLSSTRFSSAKIRPVACGDCGLLRLFLESEALDRLRASQAWVPV